MIHRLEAALQDNRSLSEILNATRRSVLNFSVSVMIAAENGPIPALHSDTGASGTGSSNPACSSGESAANWAQFQACAAKSLARRPEGSAMLR
jgi:hypothetical protein